MEHFLQQFEHFGHAKQEPQPVTARDSLKSPKEAQQGPIFPLGITNSNHKPKKAEMKMNSKWRQEKKQISKWTLKMKKIEKNKKN